MNIEEVFDGLSEMEKSIIVELNESWYNFVEYCEFETEKERYKTVWEMVERGIVDRLHCDFDFIQIKLNETSLWFCRLIKDEKGEGL